MKKKSKLNLSAVISLAVAAFLLLGVFFIVLYSVTEETGGSSSFASSEEQPSSLPSQPILPSVDVSYPDDSEIEDPENPITSESSSEAAKPKPVYSFNPRHAIIYEAAKDYIHYEKNIDVQIHPASTTKIITAMVVLKYLDLDAVLEVGIERSLVEKDASVIGLSIGDRMTVKELLTAMLISSGGDAAYTLAVNAAKAARLLPPEPESSETTSSESDSSLENSSEENSSEDESSEQEVSSDIASNEGLLETLIPELTEEEEASSLILYFEELVNTYAELNGYEDCFFETPDGYDSENQRVTVRSLAKIMADAMKNEEIRKIVATPYYEFTFTSTGKTKLAYNTNKLLRPTSVYFSPYVTGIKTGTTSGAGNCLATEVYINGRYFIVITMNAKNDEFRYKDILNLIEMCKELPEIETESSVVPDDSSDLPESNTSSSDVDSNVSSDLPENSSDTSLESSQNPDSDVSSDENTTSDITSSESENSSDGTSVPDNSSETESEPESSNDVTSVPDSSSETESEPETSLPESEASSEISSEENESTESLE